MLKGNGSSSRSTQQLGTPAAGNLNGLLSGGAGGGDKPPRHPGHMKSVHELDGAGRDDREPFQCSLCVSYFISQEDLHCHIRRCHVRRSWRRGGENALRPPPSGAGTGRYMSDNPLSLGSNPSSSIPIGKKGLSTFSKQQQLASEAAPAEAPTRPAVPFAFDLNVPVPEEDEKKSSG